MADLTTKESMKILRDLSNLEHVLKPFGPAIKNVAALLQKAENAQQVVDSLEADKVRLEKSVSSLRNMEADYRIKESALNEKVEKCKKECDAEKLLIDKDLSEYREAITKEETTLNVLKTAKVTEIAKLDRQISEMKKTLVDLKEHGRKVFA